MAADQGIQITEDGVAEVSMTYARANLTQLLREVRYGKRPGAFTERGDRSAYVVPADFYKQALEDRSTVAAMLRMIDEIPDERRREAWARDLIRYRNDLVHGT
ncbi:type II toxin-antitoxin system prevent-host-death family antitoxin [Streptomyces sp. NPDC015220]|uniref:type II toxin-antitoxin system prevent-host-death family antitoxin n=1 Tax=Streptomyces sp. NPDC015220 TaxID=3364947 RepID=UPI0036F4C6B8